MVDKSTTFKLLKNVDGNYKFVDEPFPKPQSGEVLIQVHYSSFNPLDRFLYFTAKLERVGSEGSGIVTAIGEDVAQSYLGKKVSFMHQAWAEYKIAKADEVIILDDSQDLAKAANAMVNPLSAVGILEIARQRNVKVLVQTAAASQLGKQVIALMKAEGIQTINIVRREEQFKQLKSLYGCEYVLDSSKPEFVQDLQGLINELEPTLLIDYLAGELPGQIFQIMPAESQLVIVGVLTSTEIVIKAGNLLYGDKTVRGFRCSNGSIRKAKKKDLRYTKELQMI
eukprot:403367771